MNFRCPICDNIDDFCITEPCKSCHYELRQGPIQLSDFNKTIEAEAKIYVGMYTIEGNSRSVVIKHQQTSMSWRREIVASVMIGIASFVGMDEKLLTRFVITNDWSRLEKAKVFL